MGLVINKRLPRPDFDDLLEQLHITPVPPVRRIGLCAGGPVEEGHGLVLHSGEWSGQDSLRITENVTLTSSMDVLQDIAQGEARRMPCWPWGMRAGQQGSLSRKFFSTMHGWWCPPRVS